jgi:hypothetical protein
MTFTVPVVKCPTLDVLNVAFFDIDHGLRSKPNRKPRQRRWIHSPGFQAGVRHGRKPIHIRDLSAVALAKAEAGESASVSALECAGELTQINPPDEKQNRIKTEQNQKMQMGSDAFGRLWKATEDPPGVYSRYQRGGESQNQLFCKKITNLTAMPGKVLCLDLGTNHSYLEFYKNVPLPVKAKK